VCASMRCSSTDRGRKALPCAVLVSMRSSTSPCASTRRFRPGALQRAKQRLSQARVDGETWYWPSEMPAPADPPLDAVRLLAPFDPVVWDRRRFELLWGWAYRFEAYTPPAQRKLGYYALPLLWRDRVVGWANLALRAGQLQADFGYAGGAKPRERTFARELEAEVERMRLFLEARPG
jgi:uncharacterized protein